MIVVSVTLALKGRIYLLLCCNRFGQLYARGKVRLSAVPRPREILCYVSLCAVESLLHVGLSMPIRISIYGENVSCILHISFSCKSLQAPSTCPSQSVGIESIVLHSAPWGIPIH